MATSKLVTNSLVLDSLRKVQDPVSSRDLVSAGLVTNIRVQGDKVSFDIYVSQHTEEQSKALKEKAIAAVKAISGVAFVSPNLFQKPKPRSVHGAQVIPGVNHVIVVGSGKGGVGKSTSSVNIAMALKKLGYKVGMLDADIYGPSVPTMLAKGLPKEAQPAMEDNQLIPFESMGIKLISLGMMVGKDQPTVWRAPMATKMIQQFLLGVKWGELDFLIVDLPPGTGDIQLTISQQSNISGAVLVTTPQRVAVDIAKKGLLMFRHVGVPILGLVETMSGFGCGTCGSVTSIFGEGGAKILAEQEQIPLLGQVPVDAELVRACDEGDPIVMRAPNSPSAKAYMEIAAKLVAKIELGASDQEVAPLGVETLPGEKSHKVAIFWTDGTKYIYDARKLRFMCPCAVCVDEFSGERKVTLDSIATDIALEKALPVGRYGVNLTWNDRHSTGIYTYKYLREIEAEITNEKPQTQPHAHP